jgi:hypothetical protein
MRNQQPNKNMANNEENLNETVVRLRAAGEELDAKWKNAGHAAGLKWASNHADPYQLRRLESSWDEIQAQYFEDDEARTLCVAQAINGEDCARANEHAEFWESITFSKELPYEKFVEGFVEGALEIWDHVKSRL